MPSLGELRPAPCAKNPQRRRAVAGLIRAAHIGAQVLVAREDALANWSGPGRHHRERRQQDFVNNLCGKLVAYALGRSLIPTDDELIEKMTKNLAAHEYLFENMVQTIVTSPQFANAWIQVNTVAHQAVVKVLSGDANPGERDAFLRHVQ